MERLIKFRAWHKKIKKMFGVHGWHSEFVFEDTLNGYGSTETNPANIKDCEIMQFTGLLDINGKEIYEGDILQWTSKFKDTDITTPNKRGQVKYNQQGCVWHINYEMQGKHYYKDLMATFGGDVYVMETVEVIGNIFEDKHLKY